MKQILFFAGIALMYFGDAITSYPVFWFGAGCTLVAVISFFLSTPASNEGETPERHEIQRKVDDKLPAEFVKTQDIDGHTKQITYKGKSFVIWKTRDGRTVYQEVNEKTNLPIKNPRTSKDARALMQEVKQKIDEI